jgi:hypothetical protein
MSAQESRAELQVPRDRDAKRLVEAILEETFVPQPPNGPQLAIQLCMIRDNATRLAVLLDERDAEHKELVVALAQALPILSALVAQKGLEPSLLGYESGGWVAKEAVRAALARAKVAPNG